MVYIVLKIKNKYAYITFSFIINLIYLVLFNIIFKVTSITSIILLVFVSFLMILLTQIFNHLQLLFYKDNEYDYIIATVIFNYFLFIPIGIIYLFIAIFIGGILFGLMAILAGILDSLFNKEIKLV